MPITLAETVPIRIAFCVTDLNPGGAERALVHLVTRLDRQRWDPRVYCLGPPGELVEVLEAACVRTTCFGARRWWQVGTVWHLSRALRDFRPRLLQSFLFHANLAGRLAGWMAGIKHCVSGIRVAERRRASYLTLDRWTECLTEAHVCVSQSVADFSVQTGGLTGRKLIVIPNGVDFEHFASAVPLDLGSLGINSDLDVWMTAGRLDPQKGPWILLEAVQKLTLKYPRLRLLWAGDGPLRQELQTWITQHQLQDVVHLLGWRDDMPRLLRASRGFVLASQWEGMPNVVLEALAAGLPTISTRVEGVEEIIRHGETGWLAPIGDSSELARIWSEVIENPGLRHLVAAQGQRHVKQKFTWDDMAARYVALYDEILRRDHGN